MRRVLAMGAGLAMVAALATRAEATPIGQLTTADNLKFTLSDDGAAADIFAESPTPVNDTEQFTLTLDSSAYTGLATDPFTTLALKLSPKVDAVEQTSAPSGFTLHTPLGGLNGGGCDSSGGGFFCSQGSLALNGSSYSWTFLVDPNGAFSERDIKAIWFDDGTKEQLSTTLGNVTGGGPGGGGDTPGGGTPVPEPTTLLLLAGGLAGVLGAKYRRRVAY
jgi:hypothetical protein